MWVADGVTTREKFVFNLDRKLQGVKGSDNRYGVRRKSKEPRRYQERKYVSLLQTDVTSPQVLYSFCLLFLVLHFMCLTLIQREFKLL
jgi:hypothetical protein